MDCVDFEVTLKNSKPLDDCPDTLKALWHDSKDDWHTAHHLVDGVEESTSKWIHAYLNRKEGDDWNAEYWYRQARKPIPKISLEKEQRKLIESILT